MNNTTKQYTKEEAILEMNHLGKEKSPFLFVIDYEMEKILITPIDGESPIKYDINGISNSEQPSSSINLRSFVKEPIPKDTYEKAFNLIQEQLHYGNSFLANLTFASKIFTDASMEDIFNASEAKYKLFIPNQCVVFSPESFVQIRNETISSYPMKGTIQAKIPNAQEIILEDKKEFAEHSTIVDLIRNDLSMVAKNVHVDNFRYVEEINNNYNPLLQVSSKISGTLEKDYNTKLGTLLFTLLPAGSITGAPKKKTIEIIANAELDKRGYYTGVFGYFDGSNLDSAVMIRFIEEKAGELFYRSGGGITANSNLESEYAELIDKIYVPLRKHTDTKRENLQPCVSSSPV